MKYLHGHELTNDELKAALRRAVIAYKLVPIYAGSSLRNKGVQPILDAVIDYLPSPLDLKPVGGIHPKTLSIHKIRLSPPLSPSSLSLRNSSINPIRSLNRPPQPVSVS